MEERDELLLVSPALRELAERRAFTAAWKRSRRVRDHEGHFTDKVYSGNDGDFERFVGHPSLAHAFTSEFGSLETADRGVDKITENPACTFRDPGHRYPLQRARRAARATGLWILTFDPVAEEIVDVEYHGSFDFENQEIERSTPTSARGWDRAHELMGVAAVRPNVPRT